VNTLSQLVTFSIDEQLYALALDHVDRIVRAVEITRLPKAPEIVLGVINVEAKIVPVINLRKRFNFPEREINLTDHFIIAHTSRRRLALAVDSVSQVIEDCADTLVPSEKIIPTMDYVQGIVRLESGLLLIHDLEQCLSLHEEEALQHAMSQK
jgi:purine-binding chemotaxis protein CheW